jgi:hypothetical protein
MYREEYELQSSLSKVLNLSSLDEYVYFEESVDFSGPPFLHLQIEIKYPVLKFPVTKLLLK